MTGLLLEGGGSRTWAAVMTGGQVIHDVDWGCTSARSIGLAAAAGALRALVGELLARARTSGPVTVTAAHGWACVRPEAEQLGRLLQAILTAEGRQVRRILVTNDLVPLLATGDPDTAELAVVAGTGTGFLARSGTLSWSRASGLEYLLSDEGSGFDLGMGGLRAAVRAMDGRGGSGVLLARASEWIGSGHDDLAAALVARIYGQRSKFEVAAFAPQVMAAADDGDPVAGRLVLRSQREIVRGALAAAAGLRLPPARKIRVILDGALLTEWPRLRAGVIGDIEKKLPVFEVVSVTPGLRKAGVLGLQSWWRSETLISESLTRAAVPCFTWPAS